MGVEGRIVVGAGKQVGVGVGVGRSIVGGIGVDM